MQLNDFDGKRGAIMGEPKRTLTACIIAVLQRNFEGSTSQFADEAAECGLDDEPEVSRPVEENWRGSRVRQANIARTKATTKRLWRPQRR
ncbi:hypothetical protein STRATTON_212 [Erwinia phage vB_EamM_Stratton]|uniref:Uncharacterized protein n=1 Tax=Erwinia phage vB_EamM_Stratton TaxID=1883378 RepID=A0A1B2IH90_9CAUD|nr:hypothetical protein STRATTON_212 [Erwinia phage vB_EamM_Stratton]